MYQRGGNVNVAQLGNYAAQALGVDFKQEAMGIMKRFI